MIYFDNAATTKPCKQAVQAACDNMKLNFGNASSLHKMGIEAEKVIISAKKSLLNKLGCEGEIYFTSGATESNNTALLGAVETYKRKGNKIITTTIEHPSVARVMDKLENMGFEVVRLSPKERLDDFAGLIAENVDENTILVSAMSVNNETGYKTDTKRLYSLVKSKNPNCMVHIDGVQGFCKVPLIGDFISLSAHKIHGIKGLGALYVAKNARFTPFLLGGGQQKNLRSGTEPVDLIAGFEAAVNAYTTDLSVFARLNERLREGLSKLSGITINSDSDLCVPNIVNFSVSGVRSEIMLHFLEEREIYISSGSACSKGKKSEVLSGFGVNDSLTDSALRISFCSENTLDEVDQLVNAISDGITRFRRETHKKIKLKRE